MQWTYVRSSRTLHIRGTGAMPDFQEGKDTPWKGRDITRVVIHEGVETIGARAFDGLSGLREVSLPSTLLSIGEDAFRGCPVRV